MASPAGISTAAAANTSSGTAAGRRATAGRPTATTPSSTTAEATAKSVVREPGTASPFQMPPRLARLVSVPRPGSARGANASTPSRLAGVCDGNAAPVTAATNQGSAATAAAPIAAAAHTQRRRPAPATGTQASATAAASSRPVGVSPASAMKNASPKNPAPPVRNPSMAVATHGRQP